MSRQTDWQDKMIKEGRCRICGLPLWTAHLCEHHAAIERTKQRDRYRLKHGIPLNQAKGGNEP